MRVVFPAPGLPITHTFIFITCFLIKTMQQNYPDYYNILSIFLTSLFNTGGLSNKNQRVAFLSFTFILMSLDNSLLRS